MQLEILGKLQKFLQEKVPFNEECEVMYLMVEIRKVLDRVNNNKYGILRFYCDWAVHTKKDRNMKSFQDVAKELYSGLIKSTLGLSCFIAPPEVTKFMYFDSLKGDMKKFLMEYNLSQKICKIKNWRFFILTIVNILFNQPILNPIEEIREISFILEAPGCASLYIKFRSKEPEYNDCKITNRY